MTDSARGGRSLYKVCRGDGGTAIVRQCQRLQAHGGDQTRRGAAMTDPMGMAEESQTADRLNCFASSQQHDGAAAWGWLVRTNAAARPTLATASSLCSTRTDGAIALWQLPDSGGRAVGDGNGRRRAAGGTMVAGSSAAWRPPACISTSWGRLLYGLPEAWWAGDGPAACVRPMAAIALSGTAATQANYQQPLYELPGAARATRWTQAARRRARWARRPPMGAIALGYCRGTTATTGYLWQRSLSGLLGQRWTPAYVWTTR
jgi:hypothetical protein